MMRWGELWLTACLVTATCSQFLAIDSTNSEPTKVNNTTTNNNDLTLTVNKTDAHRAVIEVVQPLDTSEEQTSETSISRELETHEQISDEHPSDEKPDPLSEEGEEQESASKDREDSSAETLSKESLSDERSASNQDTESSSGIDSTEEPNGSSGDDNAQIIVHTTLGPVIGSTWQKTKIVAYIDIPYGMATKPFEAPHAVTPWEENHEVKEHSKRCPQYQSDSYVGDLNCLTLSIFTPPNAENAGVLFYVHDSSFRSGDPMIYGPEHLVSKGIILVLPNYRIGALGFLCLQNETAPGNAGLKDLTKALEWVYNNIRRFGGNPSNIVVGGDGDAGALAGYLALSSKSKSYIQKVITESGSMLSHLALDRNPVNTATTLAKNIGDHHSPQGVLYNDMFAEVSVETIVKAAKGMRFCPCIEEDEDFFMDATPWTMLQNEKNDIIFMMGSASHAGTHEAVATTDSFIEELNEDYGLILPADLLFRKSDERAKHALKVKTQYFGNDNITRDQVEQLSLWSTDASYLGPLIRSARHLVDAGATVYVYEFDFVGNLNRELISLKNPVDGAVRSDIIGYLFPQEGHVIMDDTPEGRMTNLMVDLWVSFINTGIPTADSIERWEKLIVGDESQEEFLYIGSEPKSLKGLYVDRLNLWTELYNEYFIERSFALSLTPGYYVFIALIFCITNTQLD